MKIDIECNNVLIFFDGEEPFNEDCGECQTCLQLYGNNNILIKKE